MGCGCISGVSSPAPPHGVDRDRGIGGPGGGCPVNQLDGQYRGGA